MLIGALIGLFIGLLYTLWGIHKARKMVAKHNANMIAVHLQGRASYHVKRGETIVICAMGVTLGAIFGYFLS
jgi:hypothetical protein